MTNLTQNTQNVEDYLCNKICHKYTSHSGDVNETNSNDGNNNNNNRPVLPRNMVV